MERKDYEEKFMAIKNEILDEIRSILPNNTKHTFKNEFHVHWVDDGTVTTEVCKAVEIKYEGMVVLTIHRDFLENDEEVEGVEVLLYEPDSLMNVLDNMKKELRDERIRILTDIVRDNGGSMDFDGCEFLCNDSEDLSNEQISHSKLAGFCIVDGKLLVRTMWLEDNNQYDYNSNCIPFDELNHFIEIAKENSLQKFRIKATDILSRTFEITAVSYDDAVEKVKEMLKADPLNEDDSDGLQFS